MKKQNILNALGFLIDMSIDRHNDEQKYDKFAHDNIKKTLDLFDTLPKRTRAELLSWRQLTQLVIQLENDIVDNPEVTDLLQLILSEATGQTKTTPHKVVPGADDESIESAAQVADDIMQKKEEIDELNFEKRLKEYSKKEESWEHYFHSKGENK